MIKRMYIMRGLPGSGKSTVASSIGVVLSTDDFWFDSTGRYVFKADQLSAAHDWNQSRALRHCKSGTPSICIDNTNMTREHMEPYKRIAFNHGYSVTEILVGTPRDPDHQALCAERNVHGVPLKAIQNMASKFED